MFSSWTVTAATAWRTIPTANAWTYGTSIGNNWPGPNTTSYAIKLEARAEDNSIIADNTGTGNIDVPVTAGTDVMNFIIDDSSPTGTLTWPVANGAVSSGTVQMTGTESE